MQDDRRAAALRAIDLEAYGFSVVDLTVAALLKAYLQQMPGREAEAWLKRVVWHRKKISRKSHIERRKCSRECWTSINAAELAKLIDEARDAAVRYAALWRAQEGEHTLNRTLEYFREDVLRDLSGRRYLEKVRYEVAVFITDCREALL